MNSFFPAILYVLLIKLSILLGNPLQSEEMSVPKPPKINGNKVETIVLKPVNGGAGVESIKQLECEFEGTPTPKIIWFRDGKDVPKTHEIDYNPTIGRSILILPEPITYGQLGPNHFAESQQAPTNFTCVAANFLGHTSKSYLIQKEKRFLTNLNRFNSGGNMDDNVK